MVSIAQISVLLIKAHGIIWTVAIASVHYATRKYKGDGSEPVPLWHMVETLMEWPRIVLERG